MEVPSGQTTIIRKTSAGVGDWEFLSFHFASVDIRRGLSGSDTVKTYTVHARALPFKDLLSFKIICNAS